MANAATLRALALLSDEDLDRHLENLEFWLAFDLQEVSDVAGERARRGRGALALTPAAEDYILAHGRREAA